LKSSQNNAEHGTVSTGDKVLLNYHLSRYYNQDEEAGRIMTQTLATLPPSHRAPFSRVQASIREAYHRSVSARRHAELQAHLSFIQPGASLSAHLRPTPRSKEAQKGRQPSLSFVDVLSQFSIKNDMNT
jgi:hypothetical protein